MTTVAQDHFRKRTLVLVSLAATAFGGCGDGDTPAAGMYVGAAMARGCDVALENAEGLEIVVNAGVRAQTFREGTKLAISFITTHDAPFASPAVRLKGPTTSRARSKVVTCFDRVGNAVADPQFAIRTK